MPGGGLVRGLQNVLEHAARQVHRIRIEPVRAEVNSVIVRKVRGRSLFLVFLREGTKDGGRARESYAGIVSLELLFFLVDPGLFGVVLVFPNTLAVGN